jgi:hypothetical protein
VCGSISDIPEGIASTEAAEGRRTYKFKCCPETELAFSKAVYANKAFYRTSEKFEVIWTRVIGDCSNRISFKEKKFQLKQGSLQVKLKSLIPVIFMSLVIETNQRFRTRTICPK